MKFIRNSICLLALGLLLVPAPVVNADAAPPREPPGSSIVPAGQTMVQMLAESVVIVVGDKVQVEATFALRNQGGAEEAMDVRFPMENPDGSGDGWGGHPQVSDFAAFADGRALPINYVSEPLEDGDSITWATFPVGFPSGEDVTVTVSYTTPLGASNNGTEQAQVEYILQTGAGWYDSIGSAVITLRLPYAASASNVYLSDPWNPTKVASPVFVGREVRWEWSNLEPTQADDLKVVFVWPNQWQAILALEGITGENPDDVQAAIQLAEAYREAGSERHGFPISEPLYRLAKQAVQMGLAYNPNNADLQTELLVIELWKCHMAYPACDTAHNQTLLDTYEAMLAEHPDNERLLEMSYAAEEIKIALGTAQRPTPNRTLNPAPTPTEFSTLSTSTAAPTATPVVIVQTVVVTATPIVYQDVPQDVYAWPLMIGFWVGVVAMGGLVGLVILVRRR